MHFIGNRAIILGDGSDIIQLSYSPGYTILSVFCPILGLVAAFSAAEWPSHSAVAHWGSLMVTGLLAGGSIAAMHYVGNLGITNYSLSYSPRFLAASIIIAVGDCILVLVLFYTLREKWISSWWKRVLCAMLLAGGVSSMHFTASTHCTYTLLRYNGDREINSRNIQVIIAGTICGATAVIVLLFQYLVRMRAQAVRARSQKVTLACVVFSPDGRILVTTEGVLPCREIKDKYNHRTFDEDFNTAHPMFHWIFRVTYNWGGISDLVPRMQNQIFTSSSGTSTKDVSSVIESRSKCSSESSTIYDSETYNDYTVLFRERFCMAAVALAASMHVPLERLGVLYDRIVETGTLTTEDAAKRGRSVDIRDVEAVLHANLFGKGQVMFITRQASEDDVDKLLNAGYKFASILHVSRTLAQAMQIPTITLDVHLADIKRYLDNLKNVEKTGTWLAIFAMIPKPNQKGFDVVVDKDHRDQLPDVQLVPHRLNGWQIEMLNYMNGYRATACYTFLDDHIRRTATGENSAEIQFATTLRNAITELFERVPVEWTREARISSQQLTAHYSRTQPNRASSTTLYAFTIIVDMHTTLDPRRSPTISRIPLSFFDTRQRCYPGSPDHAILAQEIVHMFGPLLSRKFNKDKENQRNRHKRLSANSREGNSGGGGVTSRASTISAGSRLARSSSTDKTWSAQDDSGSSQYELIDTTSYTTRKSSRGGGGDRGGQTGNAVDNSNRSNSLRIPGFSHHNHHRNNSQHQPRRDRHDSLPSNAWGNGGILVSSETVIETDSNSEIFGPASPGENTRGSATPIGGIGAGAGVGAPSIGGAPASVAAGRGMGTKVAISATKPEMTFVDHLVVITKARNVPTKPEAPPATGATGTASPGLVGLPEIRMGDGVGEV
jgi:NO-binding membrane sensor protein with MHYT domain